MKKKKRKKLGAISGQDRGATWPHLRTPSAPDRNALPCSFSLPPSNPFSPTLFLPGVCVFDFAFNLVWLAVNGAWLVLGINDMTRDTPLLEFSQVRATPIDGTPPPLCLPSGWVNASLFFLFLLFFQLIKERDGHKRACWGGIWRWEKEGVPVRCGGERRCLLSACLNAWAGWVWAAGAGQPLAVRPALGPGSPASGVAPADLGSRPAPPAALSYRPNPSGMSEGGCRRWGAAPQWISGWHGGGSLLGVCALPRVPACLF